MEGAIQPAPTRKPRILLTEDEEILRHMLRDVLRFRGYEVDVAEDGDVCLRLVAEQRPDLVVLDIMMPNKDGYETAALLRADPRTAAIPILALTALATAEVRERALEAGFDLVLTKPIRPNDLVQGIQVLLEQNASSATDAERAAEQAEEFATRERDTATELVERGAAAVRALTPGKPPRSETDIRRRIQGLDSVAACSFCGRVRGAGERWREIPAELRDYLDQWTSMSHGVCPSCFAREYPGVGEG
jgi:two-component system, cell cycle response regulator DivK